MIVAGPGRSTVSGVSLESYRKSCGACIPVAIPSHGREAQLCDQTLATLQRYKWDMSKVHVFVNAAFRRQDGSLEHDNYAKYMDSHGYGSVKLHPGGDGLCAQYNRIFEFFGQTPQLLILSDTVPRLLYRRKKILEQEEYPEADFRPLVSMAFDLCLHLNVRAWSLGPCKSARNMQPGHISRRCGLLDGNCFGVNLMKEPRIEFAGSGYTTDVEFSLKAWTHDGGMVRFLGISADHVYRSAGGHHGPSLAAAKRRAMETSDSLRKLAKQHPKLLKFHGDKQSERGMHYAFRPVGPQPLILFGSYTRRGRPTQTKKRAMTTAERVRKCRAKNKNSPKSSP